MIRISRYDTTTSMSDIYSNYRPLPTFCFCNLLLISFAITCLSRLNHLYELNYSLYWFIFSFYLIIYNNINRIIIRNINSIKVCLNRQFKVAFVKLLIRTTFRSDFWVIITGFHCNKRTRFEYVIHN